MLIPRYLDPKNDVAFKRIFGTERNKDILLHFLNDIITQDKRPLIEEVELLSTIQIPEIAYEKESIVDVKCRDASGNVYIVEMQVAKVKGFEKRAQYYAAKAYLGQMRKGDDYTRLKEVIFLAITDYVMFPEKDGYKSEHVILDTKTGEHDLKDFSFTFIELPKFPDKEIKDLANYEEKWCYFFKHADDPDHVEDLLSGSSEVIKKAYEELQAHNWTPDELEVYEHEQKRAWDAKNIIAAALEDAEKRGMEKGMEKGMEMRALDIARKLLEQGLEASIIAASTGLTLEKIKTLTKDEDVL